MGHKSTIKCVQMMPWCQICAMSVARTHGMHYGNPRMQLLASTSGDCKPAYADVACKMCD